jgi:hypothetical protein
LQAFPVARVVDASIRSAGGIARGTHPELPTRAAGSKSAIPHATRYVRQHDKVNAERPSLQNTFGNSFPVATARSNTTQNLDIGQ